jgi:hypothetical protein
MIRKVRSGEDEAGTVTTTYSGRYFTEEVPAHEIPAGLMPARAAYQLIHDELTSTATRLSTWPPSSPRGWSRRRRRWQRRR